MESALLLRALWSRRRLVAVGLLIAFVAALVRVEHVSLIPPSVKSRSLSYATARTQVIVDGPNSALANLTTDINPLVVRAGVYSRLLTSPAALQVIGREARVDPRLIYAQGPFEVNQPRAAQEPTANERSSQVVGEKDAYRLQFDSTDTLPIITIYAQAPTPDGANRLASGAARGLGTYIRVLQAQRQVPAAQRVAIRQLGQPDARTVNDGVGLRMGLLIFVLVFLGWCAGILIVSRLVQNWKTAGRLAEQGEGEWPATTPRDPEPERAEDQPASERREFERTS
jgi:hypothetical protein